MNKPLLDSGSLERIGQRVRAALVANYDASRITTRTGTLRASLEEAAITTEADGDTAIVTVAPDNRQRPARGGEASAPSVQTYGPITFDWAAGRLRGYTPMKRAAAFGRGRSAGAGGQTEVIALTASQEEEIAQDIEERARQAIIARLSR